MTRDDGSKMFGFQMMAWYASLIAIMVLVILASNPRFSYSLDDPYIHLALAQNIRHGNYGINAGETVSPSSSILWPFLLVPFSLSPIRYWIELIYNIVFGLGICASIGTVLGAPLRRAGLKTWQTAALALLMVLAGNLSGLTLTGMEHCLQILLVCLCGKALLLAWRGQTIPLPLLIAAAIAPAVRYEDIVYTAAVCAALWLMRRRWSAVIVLVVSLLPAVALGLFFHRHGLGWLPNSVLYKAGIAHVAGQTSPWAPLLHLRDLAFKNLKDDLHVGHRWSLDLSVLAVGYFAMRGRGDRRVLAVAFVAGIVMMLLGPYEWFYRYDVAIRVFLLLIAVGVMLESGRRARNLALGLIAIAALVYVRAALSTPNSAATVVRQQYQMRRLAMEFPVGNVAVNDIGWVSADAYGRYYVLDLAGLASNEALRTPRKDAAWLGDITRRHEIAAVMIYPDWFVSLPQDWRLMGVLHLPKTRLDSGLAGSRVFLYATSPEQQRRLEPMVQQFAATLPPQTWLTAK
jgi:hypothetical protein